MVKVTGDKELMRALGSMSARPTAAEMDRIGITSLQPIASETAALAPRLSLKTGVIVRRHKAQWRTNREYWVAFKRGLAMQIAHLVELGTAPHSMAKGASRRKGLLQNVPPFHPGTRPEPFMTPAFEARKQDTITQFAQGIWALISEAALRAAGRTK